MNEKIRKINEKLNRNVAYARHEGHGQWNLYFSNTNKLITSCRNYSDFVSEVNEFLETGVYDGNTLFIIKKEEN